MNADPVCLKENRTPQFQETYEVKNGKLANVFVYIKSGLGKYTFDQPTDPVIISQKDCRYIPHVFGIRVGQPLTIVNDDPTLHNIHALPKNNQEFNVGQPIQGMKMNETFTTPEVMVPFKCDVHGWMNAYVGVLDHPYLRCHGRGRHVLPERRAAGHVHNRSVAREARQGDAERHARPEGNQDLGVHVHGWCPDHGVALKGGVARTDGAGSTGFRRQRGAYGSRPAWRVSRSARIAY